MNNLCNHPTLTILSHFLWKWRSSLLLRISNSMHVMRGIYIHDGSYVGCFTLLLLSASLPNFFTAERQVCRNLRQYWLKETCVLNICLPNSTMYCCDVCRQSPSLVFVVEGKRRSLTYYAHQSSTSSKATSWSSSMADVTKPTWSLWWFHHSGIGLWPRLKLCGIVVFGFKFLVYYICRRKKLKRGTYACRCSFPVTTSLKRVDDSRRCYQYTWTNVFAMEHSYICISRFPALLIKEEEVVPWTNSIQIVMEKWPQLI